MKHDQHIHMFTLSCLLLPRPSPFLLFSIPPISPLLALSSSSLSPLPSSLFSLPSPYLSPPSLLFPLFCPSSLSLSILPPTVWKINIPVDEEAWTSVGSAGDMEGAEAITTTAYMCFIFQQKQGIRKEAAQFQNRQDSHLGGPLRQSVAIQNHQSPAAEPLSTSDIDRAFPLCNHNLMD